MSDYRFALIIPAAGAGNRMGKKLPKPYLDIAGKTILGHTIERFTGLAGLKQLVIATSEPRISQTKEILHGVETLLEGVDVKIVEGGEERQHSISNALPEIDDDVELVAIHDAVRPFVDHKDIVHCLDKAWETGAAILGIPVQDTIKKVDDNMYIRETPDRKILWQAQTPQIFKKEIITEAFKFARDTDYSGTDDASMVEHLGKPVSIVKGSPENFKITYPFDLELARLLLKQ